MKLPPIQWGKGNRGRGNAILFVGRKQFGGAPWDVRSLNIESTDDGPRHSVLFFGHSWPSRLIICSLVPPFCGVDNESQLNRLKKPNNGQTQIRSGRPADPSNTSENYRFSFTLKKVTCSTEKKRSPFIGVVRKPSDELLSGFRYSHSFSTEICLKKTRNIAIRKNRNFVCLSGGIFRI